MCAIFGFVSYQNKVSGKQLKILVKKLSEESEVRGKDATGIAYIRNGKTVIYKRPKQATKMKFYFPSDTVMLTGHTRMTTQGDAKHNYNNHPFSGKVSNRTFALCHNGVLHNDNILKTTEKLPNTRIQTDSYVAVQLLEKYGNLNFETLTQMAKTVHGTFVFTILNNDNTLYLVKGDNPLCLIHYRHLGLYVYTSTNAIMKSALTGSFLEKEPFDFIKVQENEIIRIDRCGKLEKSQFETDYDNYMNFYDWDYDYFERTAEREGYLYDYCNMLGISEDELSVLYEMGYDDEEIEMMLNDKELFRECVDGMQKYIKEYYY